MKFPKLPCFVTLLLYLQHLSLFAQVTSSPTLISSLGSSSTISVCDPGEIRFTASGDSGPTAIDVEFRIDRGGTIIYPLGFSGQNPVNSILYSNFQDNDIVSARVWTYDGVGGNDFTNKVGVLYNTSTINQENKLDNKYFFGALAFQDQRFSLGIDINSYKIQNVDLTSTQARLNFVYVVQLNSSIYFLPSITLGYHNVGLSIPSFIFEDQINQTTGFISSETIDPLGQSIGRINYPDLGASFLVHSDTFFAGLSLFHLNQPNISLDKEGDEKLPFELSLQGGLEIDINPYQRGFLPGNSYLFLYNSVRFLDQNMLINMTQEVLLSSLSLSLNQRFSFANSFNFNSLGFGMGIAVENFDFGVQFNAPIRKINQVYAPSVFELYFSFDFSTFRRNNRGIYKRLQIDNY